MRKDHNHYNMFVEVAEDCPVTAGQIPVAKDETTKTIAVLQYEMIAEQPYTYTQEDVLFEVYAHRNNIPVERREEEREKFFSKGQPCLRTSALGKRYGWGIHHNAEGKLALYAVDSAEYNTLKNDERMKHVRAMRSSRK